MLNKNNFYDGPFITVIIKYSENQENHLCDSKFYDDNKIFYE